MPIVQPDMPANFCLAEERTAGRRTATVVSAGSGKDGGQAAASVAIPGSDGGSGDSGGGGAVAAALRQAFLPDGFPQSVSDDYLSERQPAPCC